MEEKGGRQRVSGIRRLVNRDFRAIRRERIPAVKRETEDTKVRLDIGEETWSGM